MADIRCLWSCLAMKPCCLQSVALVANTSVLIDTIWTKTYECSFRNCRVNDWSALHVPSIFWINSVVQVYLVGGFLFFLSNMSTGRIFVYHLFDFHSACLAHLSRVTKSRRTKYSVRTCIWRTCIWPPHLILSRHDNQEHKIRIFFEGVGCVCVCV